MTTIQPATDEAISRAAAILRRGGLVAMPTETVYGLAGVATNRPAVAAIFRAKQRPAFNPLIAHVADPDWLARCVTRVPAPAARLIDRFWPGPLTLVLPKSGAIPDLVTAGLPTVAVRCPDHAVARELIRRVDQPLAAPSANRYTHVSPTTAQHVLDLGESVELILDDGRCATGIESTVIGFDGDDRAVLLRAGGVALDEITPITGPLGAIDERDDGTPRPGPGMVARHYAPRTPLTLIDPAGGEAWPGEPATTALLLFDVSHRPPGAEAYLAVVCLTEVNDTAEAAANLFAAMRTLDECGAQRILATHAPGVGLGPAINDRLTRASAG